MAKLSNLSGEFLQILNANEAYSIYIYISGAPILFPSPRCQAEALHRRALAGFKAQLGANHPHTLASMSNLAALLEQQGKLAEAGLRSFVKRGDLPGGRFTFLV